MNEWSGGSSRRIYHRVVLDDNAIARRPVRQNTALVRAVLDRLAAAEAPWAPRFLGVDAGDELLSWLPGRTTQDWSSRPERLDQLTIIVRELHDLTVDMVEDADCVVHDDLQPRNVVLDEDYLGLVDWEQLRPGRRIEDVAQLCWSFAGPSEALEHPTVDVFDVGRRWRRVLDVYGVADRSDVVAVALTKIDRCIEDIVRQAACGSKRHQHLRDRGDHQDLKRIRRWLKGNQDLLLAAIA